MAPKSASGPPPVPEHALEIVRALRRYHRRLERKVEAMRGELAEAERAPEFRRSGETLLAYLRQVPARAKSVTLLDPHDPARTLEIALDPARNAQANAARYFKRAAKAERALGEIPPRIAAADAQAHEIGAMLEALGRSVEALARDREQAGADDGATDDGAVATRRARGGAGTGASAAGRDLPPALARDLDSALAKLPPAMRPEAASVGAGGPGAARTAGSARAPSPARVAAGTARAPSARLQPRRLRSREGWEVLIGRSNEGNDYLTHRLARSEDYWFHVHGAAGSHVVLRRGKGKNEPSKQTLQEVGAWAAYYSQARTAGKVPVIVTRKKYVRKPRKAPPGLAVCEREKMLMVRPQEPGKDAMADAAED